MSPHFKYCRGCGDTVLLGSDEPEDLHILCNKCEMQENFIIDCVLKALKEFNYEDNAFLKKFGLRLKEELDHETKGD